MVHFIEVRVRGEGVVHNIGVEVKERGMVHNIGVRVKKGGGMIQYIEVRGAVHNIGVRVCVYVRSPWHSQRSGCLHRSPSHGQVRSSHPGVKLAP